MSLTDALATLGASRQPNELEQTITNLYMESLGLDGIQTKADAQAEAARQMARWCSDAHVERPLPAPSRSAETTRVPTPSVKRTALMERLFN